MQVAHAPVPTLQNGHNMDESESASALSAGKFNFSSSSVSLGAVSSVSGPVNTSSSPSDENVIPVELSGQYSTYADVVH